MMAGGACLYFFYFWQEIWGAAVDVKRGGVRCASGNLGSDLIVVAW
jgi:hypothetical protein